jgi:hypothetical protein
MLITSLSTTAHLLLQLLAFQHKRPPVAATERLLSRVV